MLFPVSSVEVMIWWLRHLSAEALRYGEAFMPSHILVIGRVGKGIWPT